MAPSPASPGRHLWWILPLLALDFFVARACLPRKAPAPAAPDAPAVASAAAPADAPAPAPEPPPPPPPVWQNFHTPTPQAGLLNPDAPGVLQPTASGRLESAKFGSTRTAANGRPRFHEGVDIAPVARDRKGEAADEIFAVADGTVVHVNSAPGNSTYGRYVVVEHADPSLGVVTNRSGSLSPAKVLTLYAHLASVSFGIRPGAAVSAGETLGVMGHSSSSPFPASRAHLHWEVGFLLNSRYDRLMREQKTQNPMGLYNGLNIFSVDPLLVYKSHRFDPDMTFASHLSNAVPAAVTFVMRGKLPDFFVRNPALWTGAPFDDSPFVVSIAESGMPLSARRAFSDEVALLGTKRIAVLSVDEKALGRNARAFVAKKGSSWTVTDAGLHWRDLLLY